VKFKHCFVKIKLANKDKFIVIAQVNRLYNVENFTPISSFSHLQMQKAAHLRAAF
jgi:hypothetical protein